MPKMEVHARIMLPEGVTVNDVDKSLWRAAVPKTIVQDAPPPSADLEAAVPGIKIVNAYTSVLYNPSNGLVYCGLTDYDNDILYTYNPATGKFASCNIKPVTTKFDVKVHRSLIFDPDDDCIYCASATLQQESEYVESVGGKIFRHDPATGRTEVLATPLPHVGIQTICLDNTRKIIYGHGYPVPLMFAYHIRENKVVELGLGSLPHQAGCDKDGNLWGTINHAKNLFRYNPDDGLVVLDITLPEFNRQRLTMNIFYQAPDEDTCYIGTGAGALLAFDPKAVEFRYLGKPLADVRIEGLQVGSDGLLYGCGGYFESEIFAYDRESKRFYNLGPIADPELDIRCIIPHDMTMDADDVIYTGETDMIGRSTAAVWECKVIW